jgi:glycosyltransferase involved in cell wall biosynthesis
MKLITISTFWNSEKYIKDCIMSLKNQYYTTFVSYFIDDMSTDNSYEIAKKTIGDDDRFILIKNTEKKFKTKNFIDVIRNNTKINWDDVIIELDGDDKLSDPFVLGRINKVFMDKNIWLCGTRFKDNQGNLGNYGKPNPEKARSTVWNFSHMRSFRAFLFRQIKDEHLKMDGEYFKGACDIGHAIPMLEMSGSEHFHYINEPLYIYTWHNNQSYSINGGIGDKTTQSKTGGYIYRLPKYEKLQLIDSNYDDKIEKIIEKKNKKQEILDKIGIFKKEKKQIDYQQINNILKKTNVYQPSKNIKPIREHKPNKRQELIELKNGSVTKQVRIITPGKPNRKNNLPNIF